MSTLPKSAKRKIVEGTNVPIQDLKKAKTIAFRRDDGAPLSPIQDKENSPNPLRVASTQKENERGSIKVKPPPSAVKRKVDGMRVVDLRKELKSKGIETKGLKKDLQQRLLKAYSTVEKIMSPPKPQIDKPSTTNTSTSKERQDPRAEKNEDQHLDTASVEVIVFSSSEEEQVKQEDKSEKQAEKAEAGSVPCGDVEMKEETEKEVAKLPAAKTDQKICEPKPCDEDAMDIDSDEKESDASGSSNAPPQKRRGSMMMDCTPPEGDTTNRNCGVPKVTLSVDPPVSKEHSTSLENPKPEAKPWQDSGSSQTTSQEQEQKPMPIGSSRKVSHGSLSTSSIESHQSSTSNKSSEANKQTLAASTSTAKPTPEAVETTKSNDSQESSNETRARSRSRSPVRSVQAAIQMFTSKSASKPVTKPTTTPSKLPWLKKTYKHSQKVAAETAAPRDTNREAPKVPNQQQQKADTLASKAIRRPGLGVQPASNAPSTSALKQNRFLTKSNLNSATNEARKARIAEMREKVSGCCLCIGFL